MTRQIRLATPRDGRRIARACALLREARDELRLADAPRALAKARIALASAEGAERHVAHRISRPAEATDL